MSATAVALPLDTPQEIMNVLRDVEAGDRLTLQFKRTATEDLAYLDAAVRGEYIAVSPLGHALIMAVCRSGSWGGDQNRTIKVTATRKFDARFFAERMRYALESLDVEHHRPLVDETVLQDGGSVSLVIRFKDDGFAGVGELVELLDARMLKVYTTDPTEVSWTDRDRLERVFANGTWAATGYFRQFKLHGQLDEVSHELFREGILPHLELLRSTN